MNKTIEVINIKCGMPSVDEARKLLIAAIKSASLAGVPILKIIHGYGSSGKGGKLRSALRESLVRRRSEGVVARVIFGEKWSIFDPATQHLLLDYECRELRRDTDLDRYNEGITLIEVCKDQRQTKK